jgi:hypothetical protein
MSKEYLCKCNNCNAVLFDENPQVNAVKVDTKDLPTIHHMEQIVSDDDIFWGCPMCETDEFLNELN